jgi:DNA uptake protein ComE-like DNA-binding protein
LVSIIALLIVYLNVSESFFENEKADFTSFDSVVLASKNMLTEQVVQEVEKQDVVATEKKKSQTDYFNFDPNGLPEADWKRLGLSEKQIKTIKNFESKGGRFHKKEDLKKIYGIKEQQYKNLEPYIQLAINKEEEKNATSVFKDGKVEAAKNRKSTVDLNTADSITLLTIKGIGPFYAKNIIKYRNLLGGFVVKEQLMEIWKFDQEKYASIEKFVEVDGTMARKIKINSCSVEELKHPYLKWNQVNGIVNYRQKHGKFKTIDEIKNTDLVDDETLRKLAPYLILD